MERLETRQLFAARHFSLRLMHCWKTKKEARNTPRDEGHDRDEDDAELIARLAGALWVYSATERDRK